MKDYTYYTGESLNEKEYILNYKIKNNQIILRLASREKYFLPYTKENEEKVLKRMEHQLCTAKSKNMEKKCNDIIGNALSLLFSSLLILIISAIFIFAGCTIPTILEVFLGVLVGIGTISGLLFYIEKKLLKDFKKNNFFLENSEELNKNVKSNENILSNVKSKTKKLVTSTPDNEDVFTYNTIDKMSYKELRKILENIKRYKEFDFEYSNSKDEATIEQIEEPQKTNKLTK